MLSPLFASVGPYKNNKGWFVSVRTVCAYRLAWDRPTRNPERLGAVLLRW